LRNHAAYRHIMKTDFQFANLLGTVYGSGNLTFTSDGTSLISPVGNRVTIFDLVKDKSTTLPFTHRTPISRLALHPSGSLLLTADTSGRGILSHITRRITLYYFSFRAPLTALEFSPCGRYFAAAYGRQIEVWHTPSSPETSQEGGLEFAPFIRHRTYTGHYDDVTSLQWSGDSRFFLSTSKDLTGRIWSLNPEDGFIPTVLSGHRVSVLGAWFSKDQESVRIMLGCCMYFSLLNDRYGLLAKMVLFSNGNSYQSLIQTKKCCNGESLLDITLCRLRRPLLVPLSMPNPIY
jgi:periodic tryptophan protein 2